MSRRLGRTGGWLASAILAVAGAGALSAGSVDAATASTGSVSGTVLTATPGDFTVEAPGTDAGKVNEMIAYATRLAARHYPYVYGGGHGTPGVPTTGTSGKGVKGFDCSGTVTAVLAAAGLWGRHQATPSDAGVIQVLLKAHEIGGGPGVGPDTVDLFDRPGADIQMNIEGDFFGTGYTPNGGPGWMGAIAVSFPKTYREYHVLPAVLGDKSSYRQQITFEYPDDQVGYELYSEMTVGAKVQVSYRQSDGVLYAVGATNTGGTPFRSSVRSASGPSG